MNIIETVQKNLGFIALEKIDPNTQEAVGQKNIVGNNALAQAGIPAILLAIYNQLESNPEISFLNIEQKENILDHIYGKSREEVVKRISDYSKIQDNHSMQELEHIAMESMRVVKEKIGERASPSMIRNFVARHKPETLLYLPPSLDMGTLLKNNNLDDRTGKMEGPLSSLMHSVEKTFNSSNGSL